MGLELAKMWVRVRADDTGMQQDLAKTKQKIASTGAGMGSQMAGMARYAVLIGGALVVKHGLALAADLETTTIAFETMLGSAGAAKKMMADLTQFAAATPFELPQIQQATKVLLGFGIAQEQIMPTLRTLGDISAGTGKDFKELAIIYGQVKAKSRLMGDELLQFSEASVPLLRVLAKQMGKNEETIIKMTEQGKIKFADVEKALASMSGEGGIFFDLMKRQSTTVTGLWSTWKDSANKNLRDMFTALAPVTRAALSAAIKMTDAFGKAFDSISPKMNQVGIEISDWLAAISENWSMTWELMTTSAALQLTRAFNYAKNWGRVFAELMLSPSKAMFMDIETELNAPSEAVAALEGDLARIADKLGKAQAKIRQQRMANEPKAGEEGNAPLPPQVPTGMSQFDDLRGRSGFAELGRKMQDALMKKTDDNQLKMIALMEAGNAKQDELIKAVRDKPVAQVGLQ